MSYLFHSFETSKPLSFETSLGYGDFKEIVMDTAEKGFFSIEGRHTQPLYFLSGRKSVQDNIVRYIERGRNLARAEVRT
jgi:hypothetical protein